MCARVVLCGCMLVFVCDFGYCMMNDEDAYEVVLQSVNNELRYRSCALWLTDKISHAMMSEQLAEGENKVQLASI